MKPLIFLGQTFPTEIEFKREFPAYGQYAEIVRAGADTPQKVEVALYEKQRTSKRGPWFGAMQKRKMAA